MKDFSHFVLESTLELAVKAMPHDVRVGKCVEAIRRCLDSSPTLNTTTSFGLPSPSYWRSPLNNTSS